MRKAEMVELLFQALDAGPRWDVDFVGPEGLTALQYAARAEEDEGDEGAQSAGWIRWLLQRKALRGSAEALIRAAELGHVHNCATLIEESTIDVDSTISESLISSDVGADYGQEDPQRALVLAETALMRATELNRPLCVKLLLARKADPELRNRDFKTPMQIASEAGNWECMEELLAAKHASVQRPAQVPQKGSMDVVWIRKEGHSWVMGEYVVPEGQQPTLPETPSGPPEAPSEPQKDQRPSGLPKDADASDACAPASGPPPAVSAVAVEEFVHDDSGLLSPGKELDL